MFRHTFLRRSLQAALITALAVVLCGGASLAAPTSTSPTVQRLHFENGTAHGEWSWYNDCGNGSVTLDVFTNLTFDGGQPAGVPSVAVSYGQIDYCNWTSFSGQTVMPLPDGAAAVTDRRAMLSPTTVTLADVYSGATIDLTVSGTWTATAAPNRYHSVGGVHSPGLHIHSDSMSDWAPAIATATVLLHGTNLTPDPDQDAWIGTRSFGNVTITR